MTLTSIPHAVCVNTWYKYRLVYHTPCGIMTLTSIPHAVCVNTWYKYRLVYHTPCGIMTLTSIPHAVCVNTWYKYRLVYHTPCGIMTLTSIPHAVCVNTWYKYRLVYHTPCGIMTLTSIPCAVDRAPVCRCKRKRPSWRWFRKYGYDYAIRASIKKRKRNKRGELLFRVKVTQVLFSGKVKVERSKVVTLLVISSQCTCLKLRKGREYLILGHENRETNRLMVSQLSITARWRDVFARRITKWQKRLEKRRRQNRRNRTDVLSSRGRARQSTKTTGSGSSASVGKELDSSSAAAGGPSAEGSDDGDNVRHRGSSSSSSSSSSPPNSINGNGGGKRRGGQGYGSFNLDDLQNGYRHGGRYYSKELAQLHRYKLAALRELLE
ncbi:hypothetical protein RRG08_033282 [Elysia crispata]|uniref:NTR domain-containing protein n=1 Tax=Elysia crispata TaxID=231223 RepID=A0AAE0XR64_9GAST|nr:hypothetical protein RRG08_033282 [Elysia crispata]